MPREDGVPLQVGDDEGLLEGGLRMGQEGQPGQRDSKCKGPEVGG
jgi:hypothetical protein